VDLRDLDAFTAVVEHGGFRAAADALDVSQPAVSRRIRRLEEALGVPLLERGPWGLRLTGHGEALRRGATRLRGVVDEVTAETVGTWDRTLVVGAAATVAGSHLAPFLSSWILAHPEVRVTMIEDGAVRLRQRLLDGECDVALLAAPVPGVCQALPITTIAVEAVLPMEHPLAGTSDRIPVTALRGERLLLNGPSFLSAELFLAAARAAGITMPVVYESAVGQTLAALAEAGLGVAVLADNVDLRGLGVRRRPLVAADGRPLAFDLAVAWIRGRPGDDVVVEFAGDLSGYTAGLRARPTADPEARPGVSGSDPSRSARS
jgi:DNA-binding transcriptional LysR family regulator